MSNKYIIALDQGTTSSRAIVFDHEGNIIEVAQQEFTQHFPKPGWVEHDPMEIWESQLNVLQQILRSDKIDQNAVAAIGITNQRETTVVWDKHTGMPVYNAIVWQDRRTAAFCDQLKAKAGVSESVKIKTGLVLDAYFSGTKVNWILNNVEGVRQKAEAGDLLFGTIDSWLIWKFTGGKTHVTDVTNASRTMLYNIESLQWDSELCVMLDVPESMLADVRSCSEVYGYTEKEMLGVTLPISGIAGDQQAALFGQMCTEPGMAKNTYGTGCFLVLNTGEKIVHSKNNLLSTIGWKIGDQVNYALEGSVFVAGAVIQWLRDGLKLISSAQESEDLANQVEDNGGVYFVPALTGLGAPYWDQYARGTIVGITRGTTKAHIARAALESIAFQVADVVRAMEADTGEKLELLKVDGGAVANNLLLQIQADLLGCEVVRPMVLETTALGAAYLAGLAVGFWSDIDEIRQQWKEDKTFKRKISGEDHEALIKEWEKAVGRSMNWIES